MRFSFANFAKILGIFGVVATSISAWHWYTGPLILPSEQEIDSIKVPQFINVGGQPRELKFDVPRDHFPLVLAALQPAKVDRNPQKWVSLGSMEITRRGGETIHLWIFATEQEAGAFKIGNTYYRGGNSDELIHAIKDAYVASGYE